MLAPGAAHGNLGYYMLKASAGKGNGAFAIKNIAAGTNILVDKPLMVFNKHPSHITDSELRHAHRRLSPIDRAQFDLAPAINIYGIKSTTTPLYDKFSSNQFSMGSKMRWGCFVHASRFNHSCLPNCHMSDAPNDGMACRVITDVTAGEELTFAYNESVLYLTTDQRQQMMKQKNLVRKCMCSLCTKPASKRWESDMRRSLIRYLLYLFRKEDVAADSGTPISDFCGMNALGFPKCKEDRVMEPARLIVELAEREGILSDFHLRLCMLFLAKMKAEQGQEEFQEMKRLTMRAESLQRICEGVAQTERSETLFDRDIAMLKRIIAEKEGGSL